VKLVPDGGHGLAVVHTGAAFFVFPPGLRQQGRDPDPHFIRNLEFANIGELSGHLRFSSA
jgi:hypothetical protein